MTQIVGKFYFTNFLNIPTVNLVKYSLLNLSLTPLLNGYISVIALVASNLFVQSR